MKILTLVAFLVSINVMADSEKGIMPFTLSEMISLDTGAMLRLVNKRIVDDEDDQVYIGSIARTLATVVLVNPEFGPREAALKEVRHKTHDFYEDGLKEAVEILLSAFQSENEEDKAVAMVGLMNAVREIKSRNEPELKGTLEKIAHTNFETSSQVKRKFSGSIQRIVGPDVEAQNALTSI